MIPVCFDVDYLFGGKSKSAASLEISFVPYWGIQKKLIGMIFKVG